MSEAWSDERWAWMWLMCGRNASELLLRGGMVEPLMATAPYADTIRFTRRATRDGTDLARRARCAADDNRIQDMGHRRRRSASA